MLDCVEMRLRGRMLEKFIERAAEAGVQLRRIERLETGEMRIEANRQNAKKLLNMADEYRMDLTVLREEGLPVWSKRFKERIGVFIGVALGIALIVMFSARIWRVEALSLDGATDWETLREIERVAVEWGASAGRLRSSIDRDVLALHIQSRWPRLTHVGIRLTGVSLQIEVAAETAAPEVYEISGSRDLVALCDAVVVHVDALAGKSAVRAGDVVRRGQVLIRGEERVDAETMHGVRALGSVIGRVWTRAECRLQRYRTISRRTGNMNVSSVIRLGKWTLPLSEGQDFERQERQVELLPIGGLYLPMRIERTTRWETNEERVPENEEELKRRGEALALELAREKLPDGADEADCWFDYSEENGTLVVRATIEAQMEITAERSRIADVFE